MEREIQNHYLNFIPNPDLKLLKKFNEYLSKKNKLLGIEYRCLCWLSMQYGFSIKINKPFIVEPFDIELDIFKTKYLNSTKRKQLFQTLVDFIAIKKSQVKSDFFKVIIGGSFIDENYENPNDIDLGILTPANIDESDTNFNELFLYNLRMIPEGLDLVFLPESLNVKSFKVFTRLIILGNKAKYKDGDDHPIVSNNFQKRNILQLKL